MTPRTVRRIRAKTQSWSPLSNGQIIAQPMIRPIVSQGGYHQKGTKQAVIWTNDKKLSGSFELLDVELCKPVYQGQLRDAGWHLWGGNNLIADFSQFNQPGRYRLRLNLKQSNEVVESVTFPIRSSLYLDLAKKAARWYYYQRCGVEVPGWHPPCHTDDAMLNGSEFDATGGWHDGGDYNKWSHYSHYGLFSLISLYEENRGIWETEDGHLPQPLEEAVWEAEYVCKVQREDGTLLSVVGRGEDPWFWEGPPEKEPRRELSSKYGGESYSSTTLVGAAMARLARVLRSIDYDSQTISKYLQVAERAYRRTQRMDFSRCDAPTQREHLDTQAGLLLLDIEMFRATGEQSYRTDAEQRVEKILAAQDERGFFYTDGQHKSPASYQFGYCLVALWEFLGFAPKSHLRSPIINAFSRWVGYAEPLFRVSNFSHFGGYAEDGSKRNLPKGTGSIYICSAGWALATAAILLGKPDYLPAAEHQIQWILGYNPTEVSLMAGVGQGPGAYHTRLTACEGHEDGVIPGGILNGIRGANGSKDLNMGDERTGNLVICDALPTDYPIIDTDVYGWTYAYLPNEYWVPNNGWFVLTAVQVEKAIDLLT